MRRQRFPAAIAAACLLAALATVAFHQYLGRWGDVRELAEDVVFIVVSGLLVGTVVRAWSVDTNRAEQALLLSESRYRTLVGSLDELVFTLDSGQRLTGLFGRWAERHRLGDPAGRTLSDLFGVEHSARHQAAFRRAVAGAATSYDWSAVVAGRLRYLQTSLSPLHDSGARVVGAVGVMRDVTDRIVLDDAYRETNELLHAVVEASPAAIFTLDGQGRIQSANAAAEKILAKPAPQLIGELLVRPAESPEVAGMLRDCATAGRSFTGAEVVRWRDDGSRIVLSIAAAPLGSADGAQGGVVALATDISERRQADEMLQRYRLMTQRIREIVLLVGPNGRIVEANEAATRAYGCTREELVGSPYSALAPEPSGPAGPEGPRVEAEHLRRDGSRFRVEISTVETEFEGRPHLLVLARDITDLGRRRRMERLLHEIDRRILQNQPLDAILSFTCSRLAAQYDGALVQLSVKGDDGRVDIRQGAGNAVEFLDHLEVRWDTSAAGGGPTGTAIRTGRIQSRDLASDPGFEPWRERALEHGLRRALAIPLVAREEVLGALTLFTGTNDEVEPETTALLFAFADQIAVSLRAARDREQAVTRASGEVSLEPAAWHLSWQFAEEQLDAASRWASRIRSALREERFTLVYQPVIRMGNGEPEHYEALVRMIDEDGQSIQPDEFIAAAERFGLMSQIDRWVVDNVIRVLEQSDIDARIFVNVSGASLGDMALLSFIEQRVADAKLPPGRVAFEITESAAIRDLAFAESWIARLKELGCLFAIDDFGVGFSSFSYLQALSADYVKIDRSFVSDVDTNPTNRALVRAVMTVARTLGKEVIAEGVETGAHLDALRELGVELGQGYHWGRPQSGVFESVEATAIAGR